MIRTLPFKLGLGNNWFKEIKIKNHICGLYNYFPHLQEELQNIKLIKIQLN